MAYTSQIEAQTAMYNLLVPSGTLDATLVSLGVNAVYDWLGVPQNAAFDYITIGDSYEMPNDTLGSAGHSNGYYLYATVHIWSAQRGAKNPSAMVDRLNVLFHRQSLTLATLTHVYTMFKRSTWMFDQAGNIPILHIPVQYEVYSTQS